MYLSNEKYEHKLAKAQAENESYERKQLLKAEKDKYKNKKLPSTSKLLLWVVVILCLEIIIFSEYAMIRLQDMSALYTLIGVPVTLIPTVLGYYYKSLKENTSGGIVYLNAQADLSNEIENTVIEENENIDDVVSGANG